MERILTQEEIVELLSAVEQGEVETESESATVDRGGQGTSRLDLVRLPGAGHWKIPNLDIVIDSFGRYFATSLTNRLQRSVTIKSAKIESSEFEPILKEVSSCGAIGILDLKPLKASGLLIFDDKLTSVILEIQLGGATDGNITTLDRSLTTIETNILAVIMNDCCPDLQKAFAAIKTIHAVLLKVENNPRLVNIVATDAGVMTARFTIQVENFSGHMILVIPHVSLEPMRERLRDTILSLSSQRSDSWPEHLHQGIRLLHTNVSVLVAEVNLSLRDILNFQVGDVIEIGPLRRSQVRALVEGKHKFNGVVGLRNGGKAMRINETLFHGAD